MVSSKSGLRILAFDECYAGPFEGGYGAPPGPVARFFTAILPLLPFFLLCVSLATAAGAQQQNQAPPSSTARPTDIVACQVMGARTTREACEDANAESGMFRAGVGAFAPPSLIFRDEAQEVTFAITRNPSRTAVESLLGAAAVSKEPLNTYRFMSAHLTGTGFRIERIPVGEGDRMGPLSDFGTGDGLVWRWRVTALNARSHQLRIAAFIQFPIKDGSGRTYKLQPVLSRPYNIPVRVTFTQRLSDALAASGIWLQQGENWLKLLAAFLVALGLVWGALRNLRPARSRNQPAGT